MQCSEVCFNVGGLYPYPFSCLFSYSPPTPMVSPTLMVMWVQLGGRYTICGGVVVRYEI
jgi:hypothetical protein